MIDDDRGHDEAIRSLVLDAFAAGRSVDDIADSLRPLHGERSTYPASALMEFAADAYLACTSSRTDPLGVDGSRESRCVPQRLWHTTEVGFVCGVPRNENRGTADLLGWKRLSRV